MRNKYFLNGYIVEDAGNASTKSEVLTFHETFHLSVFDILFKVLQEKLVKNTCSCGYNIRVIDASIQYLNVIKV